MFAERTPSFKNLTKSDKKGVIMFQAYFGKQIRKTLSKQFYVSASNNGNQNEGPIWTKLGMRDSTKLCRVILVQFGSFKGNFTEGSKFTFTCIVYFDET